jgi:hypothetical protein
LRLARGLRHGSENAAGQDRRKHQGRTQAAKARGKSDVSFHDVSSLFSRTVANKILQINLQSPPKKQKRHAKPRRFFARLILRAAIFRRAAGGLSITSITTITLSNIAKKSRPFEACFRPEKKQFS